MWKDPIVEEVREIRDELAKKFDYDLNRIFEHMRQQQAEGGRKVVCLQPKPVDEEKDAA
jgi:hypothetical protein